MAPSLILLLICTSILVALFYRQENRKENESLALEILEKLSRKFSEVSVAVGALASGAPVRRMEAKSTGVTIMYEWPVGENPLGLPRVLSGALANAVRFRGDTYSSVLFMFALGQETVRPFREELDYQIMLSGNDMVPLQLTGVIGKSALVTSMHRSFFEEIVHRAGGPKWTCK